jgi:hypothetical protein
VIDLGSIRDQIIRHKVQEALDSQFRLELGHRHTGAPISREDREEHLTVLFGALMNALGIERFLEMPVEILDQFAVMSVIKNHNTEAILVSLLKSFVVSYMIPETSERAFALLEKMESLKEEAALIWKRNQMADSGQSLN